MNTKTKFNNLLFDLIRAQDSVTHMNEKGKEFQEETARLVAERDAIMNEIRRAFIDVYTINISPQEWRDNYEDISEISTIQGVSETHMIAAAEKIISLYLYLKYIGR